ncbi:MAG: hypothetical protein ABFC98_06010 [Candidatus Cloacimonas sp.]
MTSGELITVVQQELKGLSTRFEAVDFVNAASDAVADTGWSFPVTDNYKVKWLKQRVVRNLYFMLRSESAHKFKVDGINLQHRFDHYQKLVESMDEEWKVEIGGIMNTTEDKAGIAGVKMDAGFVYEKRTGRDLTYSDSYKNTTIITPATED